jgi:uroporphyrinogen decarboxylase
MRDKKNLLSVLKGDTALHVPIWLMRQAGRYLPEYKRVRAQAGSFMKLCLNPELASEVTLQPVLRFGMDGAILFSDILIVPHGLGIGLEVVEGKGPQLEVMGDQIPAFDSHTFFDRTKNIYETVSRTVEKLPASTTMIGFCGGPWTVALYMLGGSSRDEFAGSLARAKENPTFVTQLLDEIVKASCYYLSEQVKASAETVQIFDSWSGLAPHEHYNDWVIAPTTRIVDYLKTHHANIPIIGFPRGSGAKTVQYVKETGVSAVSIDTETNISEAQKQIPCPLQGNLDPVLMEGEEAPMLKAAEAILRGMQKPFIFNLGHGLNPQARPENVAALVRFVQNWKRN